VAFGYSIAVVVFVALVSTAPLKGKRTPGMDSEYLVVFKDNVEEVESEDFLNYVASSWNCIMST
jgi:hypothetical protein